MDDSNLSEEGRLSRQHPKVKEAVCSLDEFRQWMDSLPSVVVDEDKFYVRGGDMLKDHDQIVWEWTRKNRPDLLPPDDS